MDVPRKIRRQPVGSRVEQITVSLPGDMMVQLRKEAHREGISISRHVANIIRARYERKEEAEKAA